MKCPGNYCVPLQYICDGQWHCPNGEDEVSCCEYTALHIKYIHHIGMMYIKTLKIDVFDNFMNR